MDSSLPSQARPSLPTSCPAFRRALPARGRVPSELECLDCGVKYKDHPWTVKQKSSPIWSPTKEEFRAAVEASKTWEEIPKRLGIVTRHAANIETILKRCNEEEIICNIPRRKCKTTMLVENSLSANNVKQIVIRKRLLPYVCVICNNAGRWLEKPISLHLDHINGIRNDHRIENLRFLCPNCHSQTKTYTGKRHRGKTMGKKPVIDVAPKYVLKERVQEATYDWPLDEVLLKDVKDSSMLAVAQLLGVTLDAVRKRLITRGLWEKLEDS